jgi:phosphatidylserine/phosphatidylglycerophosphate/cardiolipin synthase-like enzyme
MKVNDYNLMQIADGVKEFQTGRKWVDLMDSIGYKDVYDDNGLPDIGKVNGQRPSRKEYLRKRLSELSGKDELQVVLEHCLSLDTSMRDLISKNIKDDGYGITEVDGKYVIIGGVPNAPKPIVNEAHFVNLENEVINNIDKARVSIHVAMAWFTNQRIADKLIEKYNEGIDIKVIIYDDYTNSVHGVNLGDILCKRIKGTRGGTMHNKFCVIDNQQVITGSYNWSNNAENRNDENAAILYDNDRASDYSVQFRELYGGYK